MDWDRFGLAPLLEYHLFAVAPEFGLRAFRNPSGRDRRGLTHAK